MVPVDFKTWVNGNTNFEAWYAAARSEFYRRQYRQVHWDDEEEEEEHNRPTDMGVSPNLYPFFLCAFRTGVRLGELLALEWGDIDFNGRFIEVKRSYYRGRTSPTKTGKTRRVDMSNQLTETLRVLYAKKKRQGLRRGGIGEPEKIFFERNMKPMEQNFIRR